MTGPVSPHLGASPGALSAREPRYLGVRLLVLACLWIGLERLLALQAYRIVPASVGAHFSLPSWMALVEGVACGLGLLLSVALVRVPGALRFPTAAFGQLRPRGLSWLHVLLLGPLVYVCALYLGQQAAMETLLQEIRQGGRAAAQAGLGDFGRGLLAASLPAVVLWVCVAAPVSEEFMFRGALWGAIQRGIDRGRARLGKGRTPDAAPSSAALSGSLLHDPLWVKGLRGAWHAVLQGGLTSVLVMLVFAAMHAEYDTGLGIIRMVAALCLGLACGVARQASRGLLAPILLHASFNGWSVATDQRWVVSQAFPKWGLVPSLLVYLGALGLLLSLALGVAQLVLSRRQRTL